MEDYDARDQREDLYSNAVRAGKRTYFFDVKATRSNELYLTITESKKRFDQQSGNFFYEKHKLFLYQEDFDKFINALKESYTTIENMQGEISPVMGGKEGNSDKEGEKDSDS
jgi:hypothetical protein